jgi:iron complex outermembrane receptor protein
VKWRSVWHEDERDLYESNAVLSNNTLRRRNRHQYNEREYHFIDANLNYQIGEKIKHDVLVGINGGYEYRQYDRLAFDSRGANVTLENPIYTGDVLTDNPGSFRRWNLYNYGGYLFDRISLTEQLTAVAGVRYDYQSGDYKLHYLDKSTTQQEKSHSSSSNFSGGLIYQISQPVSVYASYAESFKPQTVAKYDKNGNQLEPEQGEQYEVGLKVSAFDERINFSAAYFDITKQNVAENDNGFNALVGEITSNGVEANLQYLPTDNLQFQFGYTYVEAEVSKTTNSDALGNVPGFTPEHNAFAWMRYNYPQKMLGGLVGASLGLQYESKRYTDEETSKRVLLPSYTVIDAGLYYETEQMKYALNIGNITNKQYYVGGTNNTRIYPGEPLNITLSARFNFY